jgi:hypothetical protein
MHLKEFCGLSACDNTIREVCQRHGTAMRTWQREDPTAGHAFTKAEGDIEFQTDGTSVHTTGGWREMRLSLYAKRKRGEPARPEQWAERDLPAPHARVLMAGIRTCEALGPQWRRAATRLGLKQTAAITVVADGAKWIWNQVEKHLPGATGVLDVYHLSEHLYEAAHARYGPGTEATRVWVDARRRTALETGADALLAELAAEPDPPEELIAYLRPHTGHLAYRERLGRGQSIGSGLIEGACKTVIGRRLKQTGARWRVRRVERMAAICCVLYGDQWDAYWTKVEGPAVA